MSSEIGFIGLGSMGSEMVRRFVESGLGVWVHDSDRGAVARAVAWGARAASSPAEVADQVEIALVSLPTPDVVRAVALGADGLVNGSKLNLYVDLSTTGTSVAHEVAAVFTKRAIGVLDGHRHRARHHFRYLSQFTQQEYAFSVRPSLEVARLMAKLLRMKILESVFFPK